MNNLYYDSDNLPELSVSMPFNFSEQVLQEALKRIYCKEVDVETDIDWGLYIETQRIFEEAIELGAKETKDYDEEFVTTLKENQQIYSAFRVHSLANKMVEQMTDSDGRLKSFNQWSKDVEPIATHYNRAWLKTEYDTAVRRTHIATEMKRAAEVSDVLPNLEWLPSTSINPGADHRVFWHTVLPQNHPFWSVHHPGDRWNCKCSIEATDKEATPEPKGYSKNDLPARGLEENPAQSNRLFSDKAPFFPTNCSKCPLKGSQSPLKALFSFLKGDKKNCYECSDALTQYSEMKIRSKYQYGEDWNMIYISKREGYIIAHKEQLQTELEQNIKSAIPLANAGKRVELIGVKNIINPRNVKQTIKSHDAMVNGIPWEFKYSERYENLKNTIRSKCSYAEKQGAKIVLINLKKNKNFSITQLIKGTAMAFKLNKNITDICIMIGSYDYKIISRKSFEDGRYVYIIKKWLK